MKKLLLLLYFTFIIYKLEASAPLGMFVPYDITLKLKRPAPHNLEISILGEKSFSVKGFATDIKEEQMFEVNPLQIYEPFQNLISMYQGTDTPGAIFPQLLNSISAGAGGGVSNHINGIFEPTGKLSCGQVAFGAMYGLGNCFYISAYIPVCFAQLNCIDWKYLGNSTLFAGQEIQSKLIDSFAKDACKYFSLDIGNWKQQGLGDLAVIAEWEQDFPQQRRPVLKNVQANLRVGLTFPTALKTNEHLILPVPFGADGTVSLPFGGGLSFVLGNHGEVGFSGQFWYFWSNSKLRRIKTFPTQTSLLFPVITPTYKQFSFLQNFNLYAQIFEGTKRCSLKAVYQYWRKQKDIVTPLSQDFNFEVANLAFSIDEATRHNMFLMAVYNPRKGDFQRVIPQFEIFVKGTFGGTRAAIACTYGAQVSLIF